MKQLAEILKSAQFSLLAFLSPPLSTLLFLQIPRLFSVVITLKLDHILFLSCFIKASNLLCCSDKKVLPGQQWKKTVPPNIWVLSFVPNLNLEIPTSEYLCSNSYTQDCASLLPGFHSASEQNSANQFSSYLESRHCQEEFLLETLNRS